MRLNGYKVGKSFFTVTAQCGHQSTPKYVRAHNGLCRACATSVDKPKRASKKEQDARYIDCGPANWDDATYREDFGADM
jgi:hypothetical protein